MLRPAPLPIRSYYLAAALSALLACSADPPKQSAAPASEGSRPDTATFSGPVVPADTAAPPPAAVAPDSAEWRRIVALPSFHPQDQKARYQHYDFSGVWQLKDLPPLGFIGPNYERLRIVLLEVRQDERAPDVYHVAGKSKVKNNVCAFAGTIRLRHVFHLNDPLSELGPEEKAYVRQRGLAVADYEFREDQTGAHAGVFSGVMTSFWLLTGDEHIRYDDLDAGADGYSNNQFEGQWRSCDGKLRCKANWGDFRIPDSGPLDTGAGEFSPATEYEQYGWKSYATALHSRDEKAWAKEWQAWW